MYIGAVIVSRRCHIFTLCLDFPTLQVLSACLRMGSVWNISVLSRPLCAHCLLSYCCLCCRSCTPFFPISFPLMCKLLPTGCDRYNLCWTKPSCEKENWLGIMESCWINKPLSIINLPFDGCLFVIHNGPQMGPNRGVIKACQESGNRNMQWKA